MGFIFQGTRYPFNTSLDLLRFRPISPLQRLRLGIASLLLRSLGRGQDLDNIRTDSWLCQLFGEATWKRVLEPLFTMKFGPQAGSLPALYIWQRLGREKNVATRGYLRCGLKGLLDRLESAIKNRGGIVRTGAPVLAISEGKGGMTVTLRDGERLDCDWVISTIPIPVLRRLIPDYSVEGRFRDPGLSYQGVINALFFLSRPLDSFYWSPVVESDTGFHGLIEMSTLVDTAQYGDRHLIYLVRYCDRNSDLFQESDESISRRWAIELIRLYRDLPLRESEILEKWVFRAPFVEPIYPLGYMSVKPGFKVANANLLSASTEQIYPYTTSMNSSVRLANEAVSYFREKAGLNK
jgi:protoporphyrinogen oxidase